MDNMIKYVSFDSDGRPVNYDSQPSAYVALCVAVEDIRAAFFTAGEYVLAIAAPSGEWQMALPRYEWLTLVRDLGLIFNAEAGDYLPANADGYDFAGAH